MIDGNAYFFLYVWLKRLGRSLQWQYYITPRTSEKVFERDYFIKDAGSSVFELSEHDKRVATAMVPL